MTIKWEFSRYIDIPSPELKDIIRCFTGLIIEFFQDFTSVVLQNFAETYFNQGNLAKMVGCKRVSKKTFTGYERTNVTAPFGKISLPQLQVKDCSTGKRMYVTRILLGMERRQRIPVVTNQYLGLMGALAPLRVVNKFMSMMTGSCVTLMAIVRAMRKTAKAIPMEIDVNETNEFEADGTGIPILKAGKRGRELSVLVQRKNSGGIRIAGMVISSYKQGWKKLFAPLKESLKNFISIFLVTDGDTSPLKELAGVTVIVQRCLFHIAHEAKYTLWQDKVKRKSQDWCKVLGRILDITNVRRIRDDPGIAKQVIRGKKNRLTRLIRFCRENGFKHTTNYLESAKPDVFAGIENRITGGGTTSLCERVMRTVNQRINIAQWSSESALAVAKIRGAYYYNNFDVT